MKPAGPVARTMERTRTRGVAMETLAIAAAVAVLAVLFLGAVFKIGVGLIKLVVGILLLPIHLLGAVLALVGGVLLLPLLILAALLVLLALVGGLVVVPLLPFALLAALVFGTFRLLRPRRS